LVDKQNAYPYQKEDVDFFLEKLPLEEDQDNAIFEKLKAVREKLIGDSTIIDADILAILSDFENSLTKFLLLAFAEEKIDFYFVLHLYVVRKIKLILDKSISKDELINLFYFVKSNCLDSTIIPPSIIKKYQTYLTSPDPGIAYWIAELLGLDDYKKELQTYYESNRLTHSDWRMRVYAAQYLGKEDQLQLQDQTKWKTQPDFIKSLRFSVLEN
jgi:hypothetical protein